MALSDSFLPPFRAINIEYSLLASDQKLQRFFIFDTFLSQFWAVIASPMRIDILLIEIEGNFPCGMMSPGC